ncbi:MAG: hypothetical protein J4F28_04675 [Nitrosopumilaceae archaeon]|nr:hypothetical protein [Nitrosopumilaceae archaeon]
MGVPPSSPSSPSPPSPPSPSPSPSPPPPPSPSITPASLLACMYRIVPTPLFRTKLKKSIGTSVWRAGRVTRAGHPALRQKYWMVRRPAPHTGKVAAV